MRQGLEDNLFNKAALKCLVLLEFLIVITDATISCLLLPIFLCFALRLSFRVTVTACFNNRNLGWRCAYVLSYFSSLEGCCRFRIFMIVNRRILGEAQRPLIYNWVLISFQQYDIPDG